MYSKLSRQRLTYIALSVLCVVVVVLVAAVVYLVVTDRGNKGNNKCTSVVSITQSYFGRTKDGQIVTIYTLKNAEIEVRITNYGGIITNVLTPDKNGSTKDVILGFDTLEDYETRNTPYFGAIIGRYANRIAKGRFTLDGVNYTLAINDPPNALHGGIRGFDKRVWSATIKDNALVLTYTSADGEEHYPGEVKVKVTYRLTEENELIIDYEASTNKPTIINLTNHGYYNLAGHASGNISEHHVRIDADYYTPVDNTSIPTGIIQDVSGTLFDLRTDTLIGPRLPYVPGGVSYDINYAFERPGWMKHMARVWHPATGRSVDVFSTEPGVQFYTAYHLDNVHGKGGAVYNRYGAFCLEAQHYPDSPNEPTFPSTVLRPGEMYRQTTQYAFGVVH